MKDSLAHLQNTSTIGKNHLLKNTQSKKTMRIVMPLFDFIYVDQEEYVFDGGKYALSKFNAKNEIPDVPGLSKLDISYMKMESWALVAQNADRYKSEINILLLSFKIYKLARLFIKYRLCKEDPNLCSKLNNPMQYILPEKSPRQITLNDLKIVDKGFLNLLEMDTISNRTQNAIYFFHRAFHTTKMIDSFMFLMVGIESLFSNEKRGGVTKTICSRVSKFLNCKKRCEYKDIEKLYDLRSKITHGKVVVADDIKDNLKTSHELEYVVTECMKKILNKQIYKIYSNIEAKEDYLNNL